MFKMQQKSIWMVAGLLTGLALGYQNCGPAKLSGEAATASSPEISSPSTVGNRVDLNQLSLSEVEPTDNLVYPARGVVRDSTYAIGNTIIENIVLKNNDFTRIEWIQSSTSTVASNEKVFSPRAFTADDVGPMLIYGYRGQTPYFIGMVRVLSRGPSTISATTANAVVVNQRIVASDSTSESMVLEVEAPDVDVASIQFSRAPSGDVTQNLRSYYFSKLRSEAMNVTVSVKDKNNVTFTRVINYPAQTTTPPSPTTTTTTTTTTTLAPPPPPPPIVRIRTRVNNISVADAPDANNGTRVHLWTAVGNTNQAFQFTAAGELRVHGKCIFPDGAAPGAGAIVGDCNGTSSQVWSYNQMTGALKASNGLCLDVANSVMTDGTDISTWTCHGGLNQQWDFVP
jgi:hypothetical protein